MRTGNKEILEVSFIFSKDFSRKSHPFKLLQHLALYNLRLSELLC